MCGRRLSEARAAPPSRRVTSPQDRAEAWRETKALVADAVRRLAIPLALRAVQACLAGQLLWLGYFSWLEFHRGALTFDYSIFNQGTWLIAHGQLNPYDTVRRLRLWRNNGEFILWPLSVLTYFPPEGLWLLWAQDVAICATGWTLLGWTAEFLRGRRETWLASTVVLIIGVLWVTNPKVYATAAFDVHTEVFGTLFALLAGRELWRGRTWRAFGWLTLVLATGFVACTYAVALGAVVLVSRRGDGRPKVRRWVGGAIIVVAFGWMALLQVFHANVGSELGVRLGYLAGGVQHPGGVEIALGAIAHPSRVLRQLWLNRHNLWGNLAPSGLVGTLSPWGLFMLVLVTVPNTLVAGTNFAAVGFQNFPTAVFVLFGTAVMFDRLMAALRAKWMGPVLAGCVALWSGLSASTLLPAYPSSWLAVGRGAARTLEMVRAAVPAGSEVVASQGISGWFSARSDLQVVVALPEPIVVEKPVVYFVLSSTAGVETATAGDTLALEGWLLSRGAKVLMGQDGVWLFRLEIGGGTGSLVLPGATLVCGEGAGRARSSAVGVKAARAGSVTSRLVARGMGDAMGTLQMSGNWREECLRRIEGALLELKDAR